MIGSCGLLTRCRVKAWLHIETFSKHQSSNLPGQTMILERRAFFTTMKRFRNSTLSFAECAALCFSMSYRRMLHAFPAIPGRNKVTFDLYGNLNEEGK